MSSAYIHRIWCTTEGAWVSKETGNNILLGQCPNSAAHAVDLGSAALIGKKPLVVVSKEVGAVSNGHVRLDQLVIAAPAGGSATSTLSWPFDIALYTITLAITADCIGCSLTVEASPLTAVGGLSADAPVGTTVLLVAAQAAAATYPGYIVTLQSGATTQELGRAVAVNRALNTITVETATTSNFLAAGPTTVMVGQRAADHVELAVQGYLSFGDSRPQAIAFPIGRVVSATLTNPNPAPARLVVYLSLNY